MKTAAQTTLKLTKIIVMIGSVIFTIVLLRSMGLKGLLCFTSGMALMTVLIIHPRTTGMIMFLVNAVHGDKSLIEFMKEGKEKPRMKNT